MVIKWPEVQLVRVLLVDSSSILLRLIGVFTQSTCMDHDKPIFMGTATRNMQHATGTDLLHVVGQGWAADCYLPPDLSVQNQTAHATAVLVDVVVTVRANKFRFQFLHQVYAQRHRAKLAHTNYG